MKFKLLLVIPFIVITFILTAQESNCYYKYDFEEFLTKKTSNHNDYMKEVYSTLKYPVESRINNKEGLVKVILICHGKNNYEVIPISKHPEFHDQIILAFEKINKKQLLKSNDKFFTEFEISFELDPDMTKPYERNIKLIRILDLKAPIPDR